MARGAAFFPALGLILGAALVFLARISEAFTGPAGVALVLVVGLTVFTMAALPLGLARAVAELCARGRGSGSGIFLAIGLAAALVSTLVKWGSLAETPSGALGLSVPMAVMLGRWAFVVLAYGSQSAGPSGAGAVLPRAMEFREFSFASVFTMATCLVLADAIGLIFLLWTAAQTVVVRIAVHRWWGGVSRSTLAAGAELAETAALFLGAILARTLLSG